MLLSDKFYRSFVLVPHEICVKKLLLTETIYLSRIKEVLRLKVAAADLIA